MITNLFVLGIISILVNLVLLIIIAALSSAVGLFDLTIIQPIYLATSLSYVYILFNMAYAVVTIIGIILGFFYKDCIRKIGVIILIIANLILIPLFLLNCIFFIAWYASNAQVLDNKFIPLYTRASIRIVLSVFQLGLFVYNICHIIVICNSFRNRIGNRQAEEYQGTESVGAI